MIISEITDLLVTYAFVSKSQLSKVKSILLGFVITNQPQNLSAHKCKHSYVMGYYTPINMWNHREGINFLLFLPLFSLINSYNLHVYINTSGGINIL